MYIMRTGRAPEVQSLAVTSVIALAGTSHFRHVSMILEKPW